MLKILGAALIIISTVLIGTAHNKLKEQKINELEKRILFFSKLREKVGYDNCDLATAMKEAAEMSEKEFSDEIISVCDSMKESKYKSFFDAWKSSVKPGFIATEQDNEIIADFMKTADNGSGAAVISAADNAICKIKERAASEKSKAEKNKKVYFALWIYAGIFLIIVLI